MASREGMIFKFFEKWKKNRLNKLGKDLIKNNPQLEKDLKALDDTMKRAADKIKKGYSPL